MTPDELARLIPPEVAEAAAKAAYHKATEANAGSVNDWDDPPAEAEKQEFLVAIRAALAAGLAAWPDSILMPAELILPLPQEVSDD